MRDSKAPAGPGAHLTVTGALFRVWAPDAHSVEVLVDQGDTREAALQSETGGYFAAEVSGVRAGARYAFRLDSKGPYPDPCSRFQPEGSRTAAP